MVASAAMAADQDVTVAWTGTSRFSRTREAATPAPDWERCVAELSRQLDEVQAKLAFAQRQLERDRQRVDRSLPERREPSIRLVRERSDAAVRELEDLTSASPERPLPMLAALGREEGIMRVSGRTIRLSRRHTEIVALLAANPQGMTTEELAVALYGETGRPASVRVELCRLRKIAPRITNERNRVKLELDADFLVVQRLLRAGRALEAAQRYPAALLPGSEAPGIVDAREELEAWMRSAVMASDDPAALWAWLESSSGWDDALAWKRFLADLDFADPRRPLAVSRLARLRQALTVVC
jgi:hypothetical protein